MEKYTNDNDLIRGIVILGDFVLLNALIYGFMELYPQVVPVCFYGATKISVFVANVAMVIAQYFYRTIIHYRRIRFEQVLSRVSKLVGVHVVLTFVFLRLLFNSEGFFSFLVVFAVSEWLVIMLARLMERTLLKHYRRLGRNTRRVVMVGDDPALLHLYADLMADSSTGYRVVGYYGDKHLVNEPQNLKYLGTLSDLQLAVDRTENSVEDIINPDSICRPTLSSVDEMFVCLSHEESELISHLIKYCDRKVIRFFYLPREFGRFHISLKTIQIGDLEVMTNHMEPLSKLSNRFIKRTFDIVVSSLVLLCMLPFIPIIALIIKIQSPGPVFFKQERTGINGHTFMCYKFRSMHVNKDADKIQATKNDPRKFKFGDFMRKTNIDEFPQFFNVLKGDMSIVGPRPHMLHHTEMYAKVIDKYMVRHFCKPGITGYAQVTGFRGETKELWQMEGRVRRDVWYVENWSLWLDLRIIFKTAWTLIVPDKHAY